jgi:phosphate starvation-inducible protein PhoH
MARQKLPPSTPKRQRGLTVVKDIADYEKNYHHSAKQEIKFLIPNEEQKKLVHSIRNNSISLVTGNAGTGKTLFCIQTLYQMLKARTINGILIIRLVAGNRDEDLGSLPGEVKDKTSPFWEAIRDNLELFVSEGEINYLFDNDKIKVLPMSFVRGRTFHNKGIIIEEAQNLNKLELITVLTRIGRGTKMVFNGDDKQCDRHNSDGQGMHYLKRLLTGINDIGIVDFKQKINERHPLITDILQRVIDLKVEDNKIKELAEHFERKQKHLNEMDKTIANTKWDVDLDFCGQPKKNNLNHG